MNKSIQAFKEAKENGTLPKVKNFELIEGFPIQFTDEWNAFQNGLIQDFEETKSLDEYISIMIVYSVDYKRYYTIKKRCINPCGHKIDWDTISCTQDVL